MYDMNGFKLTTKDGFVYYFLPTEKITKNADVRTLGKLLTDKEYDNRFSKQALGDEENVTEYCFTKGERQKLYVVNRKVSTVLKQKLSPSTLSDIVEENDNWYKRSYKINSVEEFTPSKIYFNATVLYTDESHIITLFQNEAGDNATTVTLQCLNTDKTIKWTKTVLMLNCLRRWSNLLIHQRSKTELKLQSCNHTLQQLVLIVKQAI